MLPNIISTSASVAAAAALLPSLALAAAIDSISTSSKSGCQALATAGLSSQVYYPTSSQYADREASYWSVDSALGPKCIVQPRNTAEVALALKTLANFNGEFAVRSGGHSQWAGANDIADGVTIDLGLLTSATYNPSTGLASIQPGPKWGTVLATLATQGVVVAGGRDANVGIGGFLTGGGNSYYAGRLGMACDTVVNHEVALANGTVINANRTSNADLHKALKGGSGNFGIVTRFDLETLPSVDLWGGIRASNRTYGDAIVDALIKFVDENEDNDEDALLINFTYNPSLFTEVVIAHVLVDTYGAPNAPTFNEVRQIPAILEDLSVRSAANIAESYVLPSDLRNAWFTFTIKNDARIVKKAGLLNDIMVKQLLTTFAPTEITTQLLFQPLPAYFAQLGVAKGGNVLGMDSVTENALLVLGTIQVATVAQEKVARKKLFALKDGIEKYAKSVGGDLPWVYLNYADGSQSPIPSYGAANVEFIKKVSKKYDPDQVFQKKVTAGFKINT